jgi:hypothetical protein
MSFDMKKWRRDNRDQLTCSERKAHWRAKGLRVETVRHQEVDQRCEACGIRDDRSSQLVPDHDHATGAFRGWLCRPCNIALGIMRDDPEHLGALQEYARGKCS